jgi:hypothetical protein
MGNDRVNRHIMTMTLAEFFVIVQTCIFSSLATTNNDTYSYCIFV